MVKNDTTIQIGVVGTGHLGNFHLKQLKGIPHFTIAGLFDRDPNRAIEMSKKHDVESFSSVKDLLQKSEAISIITPTPYHYEIGNLALDADCHLFIEKPITDKIEHARLLLEKANRLNKIIQVGHIERFNPAFAVLKNLELQPRFIEAHRLAEFNPRGNDVPVILDLMIHDLDIILSLVKSEIKEIRANGVKVVSSSVDIANARLEFENGCIANVTASRISQKVMRKMRLFQEEDYITIDFHNGILEEYKICTETPELGETDQVIELKGREKKYVLYRKPDVIKHDALKEELIHFAHSINNSQKPETDGESAAKALSLALEIQKIIDS
ncbi:MAG: Gfo/Idh/MocA family oxidoreductase [Candidatus Marinimicrobia bacterium]|nr:Gfo/Idh/MocA family oxidoreductase [Candidatus Neomarinimicrobiota bacterium]